jgi:hypothetical protein
MNLWWLAYSGEGAVIIEGKSLAHARLLAAAHELGRASQFLTGYPIDPELVQLIPAGFISRTIPPDEARELLILLKNGARKYGATALRAAAA